MWWLYYRSLSWSEPPDKDQGLPLIQSKLDVPGVNAYERALDDHMYSVFELKAHIELTQLSNFSAGLYFTDEEINSVFHISIEKN